MNIKLTPCRNVSGEITVPPDKSISHRSAILASLAKGRSALSNFLRAEDCLNTLNVLKGLGVEMHEQGDLIVVNGKGRHGLNGPGGELYFGNSGTGLRLMAGVLSGQRFSSILTGDASLSRRPMSRITVPLTRMGAEITASEGEYPPLKISPGTISGITYDSPIASAQVKSCVLLAGVYPEDTTAVREPVRSRDHTERMMRYLGIPLEVSGTEVTISGGRDWDARDIRVPGDLSSAAFFITACMLFPGSEVIIRDLNLNPTRTGFLEVARRMGASVCEENLRDVCCEPLGDIRVSCGGLRAVRVESKEIPSIIDELPLVALLASQADGTTVISGAGELRKKETDRLHAVANELNKMGQKVKEYEESLGIEGRPGSLTGAGVSSYGDHRMAMMLAVASLRAEGVTTIDDTSCISTSFPGFFELLDKIVER